MHPSFKTWPSRLQFCGYITCSLRSVYWVLLVQHKAVNHLRCFEKLYCDANIIVYELFPSHQNKRSIHELHYIILLNNPCHDSYEGSKCIKIFNAYSHNHIFSWFYDNSQRIPKSQFLKSPSSGSLKSLHGFWNPTAFNILLLLSAKLSKSEDLHPTPKSDLF